MAGLVGSASGSRDQWSLRRQRGIVGGGAIVGGLGGLLGVHRLEVVDLHDVQLLLQLELLLVGPDLLLHGLGHLGLDQVPPNMQCVIRGANLHVGACQEGLHLLFERSRGLGFPGGVTIGSGEPATQQGCDPLVQRRRGEKKREPEQQEEDGREAT